MAQANFTNLRRVEGMKPEILLFLTILTLLAAPKRVVSANERGAAGDSTGILSRAPPTSGLLQTFSTGRDCLAFLYLITLAKVPRLAVNVTVRTLLGACVTRVVVSTIPTVGVKKARSAIPPWYVNFTSFCVH